MNAVTALVYQKNGSPARRVKIRGSYNSSFIDGSTETVLSDSNGRAVITWGDNPKSLKTIYINGKSYKNKYMSGSTHTFTI